MSTSVRNSYASPGNRRKNNDVCGKSFLKFVIYVFNFIFLLTGAAFLGLGLYIMIGRHTFISLLGSSLFPVVTYLTIAIGGFILFTAIIGCCGACTETRCSLFMFAVFLLVIFLVEAIVGVLAYMYEGTIREDLSRNLNTTMMENYRYNEKITTAVDSIQSQFHCCGAYTFEDWQNSSWLTKNPELENKAPDSCCKTRSLNCAYSDHPSNIYYVGCITQLERTTKNSLILIGGVGLGLCCVQIIGIIFSCCLASKIKERKYKY